ncbi:unnamed protein product [Lasius platythorax]|uniref:Uncharacterized protein n=1 Tax=Lasius platythorax TaxID=488582 RepID=A0AAV2NBU3_9HYME
MVRSQRSGRIRQIRRLLKALHAAAEFVPPTGYYADLLDDFDRLTGHAAPEVELECEIVYEKVKIRQKPRVIKIEIVPPTMKFVIRKRPEVITID